MSFFARAAYHKIFQILQNVFKWNISFSSRFQIIHPFILELIYGEVVTFQPTKVVTVSNGVDGSHGGMSKFLYVFRRVQ